MMQAAEVFNLDDAAALRQALMALIQREAPGSLVDVVVQLLVRLSEENKQLQVKLAKAMRTMHGRKSEKISPDQLSLFQGLLDDAANAAQPEAAAPSDTGPTNDDPRPDPKPDNKPPKKRRAKPHGRGKLPEHLPRVDNVIEVPEAERVCAVCGSKKRCIGHEVSERLDYVPATLRVICDKREKLACQPCQGQVSIAPTAPKVVEGGMAGNGLVAHVLVSKYIDGLTLYRLSRIYERSGVKIPTSTLGDIVHDGAHLLLGPAKYIAQQALASYVINQDDTGLRVLDRDHPKGIKRGHIWAYCGDAMWHVYRYAPNWRGEYPCTFLESYNGVIQGDGYSGITSLFNAKEAAARPTRAGCMMHARRYFFDAHKAGDTRAGIALALIHDIYQVERLAKDKQLSPEARLQLRQAQALPILQRLKNWMGAITGIVLPKSPLGKAFTYAQNQWAALLVPFYDGRLEIDNGEAERRLKLLATGRKNWLFAGSDAGAERAATILTVVGTAVAQRVDPLAYLTDIFGRIAAGFPSSRMSELMPLAWAEQRGQQIKTDQPSIPRLIR